jgi:hypothetical protein
MLLQSIYHITSWDMLLQSIYHITCYKAYHHTGPYKTS